MFFKLAVTFLFAAVATLQVNAEQHTVTFVNKYVPTDSLYELLLSAVPI